MTQQTPTVAEDLLAQQRRATAVAAARAARRDVLLERFGIFVPFVLIAALGVLLVPNFLSSSNIANMLVSTSIMAIIGYGMTLVIALRGLDLSVGSVQGLTACVTAATINASGVGPGIVAGLLIGALVGLVNGAVVAYLRVPAFVATLATLGIVRGAALLFTNGSSIRIESPSFGTLATGRLLGVPYPFLLALVLLGVTYVVLERTPFGRHICAVGGRPEAAADSGIGLRRVTVITFVIVGLSAGVAGVLLASQLGLVDGTLGAGLELQIIAITVLGGTSLAGGSGNLVGTLIAAFLLAMISSGLNLLNIPAFYQYLAVGVLLLLALSLDSLRRRAQRAFLMGA